MHEPLNTAVDGKGNSRLRDAIEVSEPRLSQGRG
jgi:hypothetical protein